jgi:hypothetical protein
MERRRSGGQFIHQLAFGLNPTLPFATAAQACVNELGYFTITNTNDVPAALKVGAPPFHPINFFPKPPKIQLRSLNHLPVSPSLPARHISFPGAQVLSVAAPEKSLL